MSGVKKNPDSNISKQHGEKLLRDIIGCNNPEKTPPIFVGLDKEVLLWVLMEIYNDKKKVAIEEVLKGKDVIREGDINCANFYLVLKGKLGIYQGDEFVADVDKLSVVGEMGFLWAGRRTASVRAIETSYLLPLDRKFINSLPDKDRAILMENIATELSRKLYVTTTGTRETGFIDSNTQDLAGVQGDIKHLVDQLII